MLQLPIAVFTLALALENQGRKTRNKTRDNKTRDSHEWHEANARLYHHAACTIDGVS